MVFFVQIHFLGVCWLDSLEYCKNFNIACHSVSSDLRWPSLQEPGLPQNPIATCHPWQSSCSLGARVTTQCLILLTLDNNIMRVFYWQFETNGYKPTEWHHWFHSWQGGVELHIITKSSLHYTNEMLVLPKSYLSCPEVLNVSMTYMYSTCTITGDVCN